MPTRKKKRTSADPVSLVGGCDLPPHLLRDVPALGSLPKNPVDRQILRLLALHPKLKARFGRLDLKVMDACTKKGLLDQLQQALGIREFRKLDV
jgi:hypothetical protein